ncbi:MAG: DUF2208 family protein [Candidatus Diapherotrites archaeon]
MAFSSKKTMFVSPQVDLVLVAALFAVITQTIQTVLTDRKEMRKNQKKMQEKNKEYKELMAKGKEANPQELERVQQEMMSLTTMSMKTMPKLMIGNMIVFIPLYAMISQVYQGITVPLFPPFNWIWKTTDWFWYYVLCSFIISLFVNHVINWYFKKQEEKQPIHAQLLPSEGKNHAN